MFSNFAPLNCELSLAPLRLLLERALRRGGRFMAVVLPRLCPMEVALFMARAEPRRRCAAFAAPPSPTSRASASRCGTTAPPTSTARSGAGFRRIETRSLGLFLPPLGFGNAFARVPGLLTALAAIEDRAAACPALRRMGDHVLLVYERA